VCILKFSLKQHISLRQISILFYLFDSDHKDPYRQQNKQTDKNMDKQFLVAISALQ